MKLLSSTLLTAALLISTTAAHSWCDCVDDASTVDEVNHFLQPVCNGYPRNKGHHGDWIWESTNYLWDLAKADAGNGEFYACHPDQRDKNNYPKPITTANAGQSLRLRFWGNGHTSYSYGRPIHRDPGLVRVYCAHNADDDFKYTSQLTLDTMVAEGNFSADAVSNPKEGGNPNDVANWMYLNVPTNYAEGNRYMCVWTWAPTWNEFTGKWDNKYTTCFDLEIKGKQDPTNDHQEFTPGTQSQSSDEDVQKNCEKTCNRGGQASAPCTGKDCPPCRYTTGCFDYVNGKCPWGAGFDCNKLVSV